MSAARCCFLVLLATLAAFALRLPFLEQRPMHGDEAVNAYKFGELLEDGHYQYDPEEYHGPTLYYLTLASSYLAGLDRFVDLNEYVLRLVPVVSGVLLVVLFCFLHDGLGWRPIFLGALFTAISPAFVFYSRYFIHEILLVLFTFGALVCGYRYYRNPHLAWAIATGFFLGLMSATKETYVIAFFAMAVALGLTVLMRGKSLRAITRLVADLKPRHLLFCLGTAFIVAGLLYSSFLSHPKGLIDHVLSYETYLNRAGSNPIHAQPWHYYLSLLAFYQYADGPAYTEIILLALALVGLCTGILGKRIRGVDADLLRFLSLYTLTMTAVYSLIPYKTPWCLLGMFHGMITLAGVGASFLLSGEHRLLRRGFQTLLCAGILHLTWQAYSSNFKFYSDSRNPYNYAPTSEGVLGIADRIAALATAHEDGDRMRVEVACPNSDYWPLPWYLRDYRVEFGSNLSTNLPAAPVILIQPELEAELVHKLYELPPPGQKEMYMHLFYAEDRPEYVELRPQVELRGFVAKALLDRYEASNSKLANQVENLIDPANNTQNSSPEN